MISKETYDKMQEYKTLGLSMLKATEKLGISYNTTYKWWNKTDEEFTSFQKEHEFVLDNYRQFIVELLKLCPQINNTLVMRRLKETFPEFEIPNATFYRYMKRLREQTGLQKPPRRGAIRDETDPGYEGQVDFGQYTMQSMYGNNIRVYFFCTAISFWFRSLRISFASVDSAWYSAGKATRRRKARSKALSGMSRKAFCKADCMPESIRSTARRWNGWIRNATARHMNEHGRHRGNCSAKSQSISKKC